MLVLIVGLATSDISAQRPRDIVGKRITGKVVGVIDGDTVELLVAPKRVLRIRLHGIDTPERGEPFNTQARNFTRVLMFSREVEAVGKDVDPYGRLVARVTVDGRDASIAILAAGLGCTFHRYASEPALDMALARARDARQGFWAIGATQPACVARELKQISRPRGPFGNLAHPSTTLGMTLSLSPLDRARGDPEALEGSKGQGRLWTEDYRRAITRFVLTGRPSISE